MNTSESIRVLISYSHDSKEHKERVLRLAKRLESNGIDCYLDQYVMSPPEGWARWMHNQIRMADFVLVICTATYQERYEGTAEPGKGAGAKWEGLIIRQEFYEAEGWNSKFIPIAFTEDDAKHIPIELRSGTWYVLDDDDDDEAYLKLYARITNQPRAQKGPLGERLILTPADMDSNVATSEGPSVEASNLPPPPEGTSQPPSHEQVLEILGSVKGAVEGSDPDKSAIRADNLGAFEIVRHHLFSTALMSSQVPSSMLGTHETHLLYLHREQLQPLLAERSLLFRMLLNDDKGLIPGWYWFSWLEQQALREALYEFAFRDRNIGVRANAWALLAGARIPPVEDAVGWASYSKAMIADESAFVRKAALLYIGAVGGKSDIPVIKSSLSDDDLTVRKEAAIARLLVLARTSPDQVLVEEIPAFHAEKTRVLSELKANAEKIRKEDLLKALREHKDKDVRLIALNALKRKGKLTKELASSMLEDVTGKAAEVFYRILIEQGREIPSGRRLPQGRG